MKKKIFLASLKSLRKEWDPLVIGIRIRTKMSRILKLNKKEGFPGGVLLHNV